MKDRDARSRLHRDPGPGVPVHHLVLVLRGLQALPGPALSPAAPALHARLAQLSFLLGEWKGLGVVGYPTIQERNFEQEISVGHDGRPFLSWSSRSWLLNPDGSREKPSGTETGFWRPGAGPRDVELVLAHPTGIIEISVGEVVFNRVELVSDVVARTHTAKEVNALKRLYGLVEGDLAYAVDLAAVGQPLQAHLSARLQRQPG